MAFSHVTSYESIVSMDWHAVAIALAERSDRPLVILDRDARVRMLGSGIRTTLGLGPGELEVVSWIDAFTPKRQRSAARSWIRTAFRGALPKHECEVAGRDGRRWSMAFDITLFGSERERGLILVVRSIAPANDSSDARGDIDYDISIGAGAFGKLRRISWMGGARDPVGSQERCFERLHQRSSPCVDCPVLREAGGHWPRTAVRARTDDGQLEVVNAEPLDGVVVRLSVRTVAKDTLDAIHEAKVDSLSKRSKLSERERSVFAHLVGGRSLDEIASALGISVRTVKFHQANVLAKLGADSRIDLARLIF